MLFDLFARLFGRKAAALPTEPDRVAAKIEGRPPAEVPEGTMLCLFRRGLLVDVWHDGRPRTAATDETCWLLPADDVPVPVSFTVGSQTVASRATVRFEPDSQLAALLEARQELLRDDLAALATSELAGLLDLLGHRGAADLVDLDDDSRERLRAKLSLLLQTKGLRCTGLSGFRTVAAAGAVPETAIAPVAAEQKVPERAVSPPAAVPLTAAPAATAAPPTPAELEPALAAAIRQVKTDSQWEDLLGELEAAGMHVDEEAAAELDELGEQVVDGEAEAGQAAARIRGMAEDAARQAGIPRPDLRRWQGLALRLRLMGDSQAAAESGATPAPTAGSPAAARPAKRPWTWWMLRRRSVDERLRSFLKQSTGQTRAALEQHRSRLQEIRQASEVRGLEAQLRLIGDLLSTVPTLEPRRRKLRPDRARVKELVQSVDRAVTAAELAQAQAQAVVRSPAGSSSWQQAVADTAAALSTLAEHLRARRAIR